MDPAHCDPRPLVEADLDWVLDLAARRRERIVDFAPRFWRPAASARTVHETCLRREIRDAEVASLRTDHGFLFAAPRGRVLDVDDMALDDDCLWPDDGRALLLAASDRGDLRFVCPVPEPARRETAIALGMSVAESWWHRELATDAGKAIPTTRDLTVAGAVGMIMEAPPVYDPGGPVLLVLGVDDHVALGAIEQAGIAAGAVLSIVSRSPDQPTGLFVSAGYTHTTDFFERARSRPG